MPAAVVAVFFVLGSVLAAHAALQMSLAVAAQRRRFEPLGVIEEGQLPSVTVQLPLYNERYVVEQLLDSVGELRYPRDRLEIQVLDDSTDETTAIAAAKVAELVRRGLQVTHLRREERDGYKAGALEEGLARARGDLIAIFDADFMPTADFLLEAVPLFAEQNVGVVQGRWGHANRLYSGLTRLQALMLDAHFGVEQEGRNALDCFFNFNGSGGIWRAAAIQDAGGWTADTLAEDLNLSYRAQLRGWRFIYRDDIVVPAELPTALRALRSQQFRWMKGQTQNARLLVPTILRTGLSRRVKLHACAHLLQGVLYPVVLVEAALAVAVAALVAHGLVAKWTLLNPALAGFVLLAPIYYLPYRRIQGRGPAHFLAQYLPFLVLATGLTVHNCVAVVSGLRATGGEFVRTPKQGLRSTLAHGSGYAAAGVAGIAYLELAVWFALASSLVWAAFSGILYLLWLHFLLLGGLTYVIARTLTENVRREPSQVRTLVEAGAHSEC
jgi:cellulose synthase/poly-beta-1,6-N-acetylglucosamine synthase-like glycosyltransferase